MSGLASTSAQIWNRAFPTLKYNVLRSRPDTKNFAMESNSHIAVIKSLPMSKASFAGGT